MSQILRHTVHASKKHPLHAGFLVLVLLFTFTVLGVLSRSGNSLAAGSPPINTIPPSLSGTAAVGEVLTVNEGNWTGAPTFEYQWRSCNSAGNSCADISGATNKTYTVQAADVGGKVKAVVIARDIDETTPADSDLSDIVQAQLGDINGDGIINLFDLGILLGKWQSGSPTVEDLVKDGVINQADLDKLLTLYQP